MWLHTREDCGRPVVAAPISARGKVRLATSRAYDKCSAQPFVEGRGRCNWRLNRIAQAIKGGGPEKRLHSGSRENVIRN